MTQAHQHSWRTDLWSYAVRLYESPGIKDLCLDLQNRCGLHVNLLLWSAWLESESRPLTQEVFADAAVEVQFYSEAYLEPLRKIRADIAPLSSALKDEFKMHILRAELCVERQVIIGLQDFSDRQMWVSKELISEGHNLDVCLQQYCDSDSLENAKAPLLAAMAEIIG